MIFPGVVVIAVLETMSYDTWITITRFPCSATIREELAQCLINMGFVFREGERYGLTELGQVFLNNARKDTII